MEGKWKKWRWKSGELKSQPGAARIIFCPESVTGVPERRGLGAAVFWRYG